MAGNELSIDGESSIGGGLIFGGRSLTLDGSVGRGITSGTESARVDGPVGKTVRIAATNVTIDQDAVIQGDLEYSSDNEAVIEGAVLGEIIKADGGLDVNTESFAKWLIVGYNAWAFFGAAIIGIFAMILMPQLLRRADANFKKKFGKTVAVGLLAALATIPGVLLLMATVFGIPMALIVLVFWLLGIYFAKFFVAYSVGRVLFEKLGSKTLDKSSTMYFALLTGLVLYYLLRLLPGVGLLVRLGTVVVGLGMMLSLFKRGKKQTKTQN